VRERHGERDSGSDSDQSLHQSLKFMPDWFLNISGHSGLSAFLCVCATDRVKSAGENGGVFTVSGRVASDQ
jgi:hypothetical protein